MNVLWHKAHFMQTSEVYGVYSSVFLHMITLYLQWICFTGQWWRGAEGSLWIHSSSSSEGLSESHEYSWKLCVVSYFLTWLNLCFQGDEGFDDLKGAFGYDFKVEQTSTWVHEFQISVCSLISSNISVSRETRYWKLKRDRVTHPTMFRFRLFILRESDVLLTSADIIAYVTHVFFF